MITRKLVLVLGAGASHPYGFPVGHDLATQITNELRVRGDSPSAFRRDVVDAVPANGAIADDFRLDLWVSHRPSIDAFLDARREFLQIGKTAIVRALLPIENDGRLLKIGPDAWYHYLFERLYTQRAQDLQHNNLTVITFNFDRSLERAWRLYLQAAYGLSDEDAGRAATSLPVLHVNGQLGGIPWLNEPNPRPYDNTVTPDIVCRVAEQIRIVHEEIPVDVLQRVRMILSAAESICFLGFGYHPLNLERVESQKITQMVYGTAFGVPDGERGAIQTAFRKIILADRNTDVLTFLRETDFIHGG